MIIYEITADIGANEPAVYEKYMRERHIPDLLATGNFVRAFFTRREKTIYRIQYHAADAEALEKYLQNDAPRLREHFQQTFSDAVKLARENWEIIETWNC